MFLTGVTSFQFGKLDDVPETKTQQRLFGGYGLTCIGAGNSNCGLDSIYKIFCVDIDGIPDNVTKTDCVNECPFGYGIRADGKIMNGKRADEWLEKDIQGEN
mgnify:CR=1 FL=1